MKSLKIFAAALCLFALGMLTTPSAYSDERNKKTKMTFTEPVEVPGMVLPAGVYTFALRDSLSDRNIVQISNEDQTKVFVTILAINNYRLTPTGKTVMTFSERPSGTPEALHAWFYPGDNFGQEFVYPKHRALELATSNKAPVLATRVEATPDVTALESAPLIAITPEQTEEPVAAVVQPQPQTVATADEPSQIPPVELPKTASSVPILIVAGLLFILIGVVLRFVSKPAADLRLERIKK